MRSACNGYKLFCFDMDGTLLDSMHYWCISIVGLIRGLGLPLPPEREAWAVGNSVEDVLQYYADNHGFTWEWDDIFRRYRMVMERYYYAGLDTKPGARAFLQRLQAEGIRVCVGTATDRNIARKALECAGLLEYVEFVTDIEEVGCGKERVEFFQRIAQRAGVEVGEILMFEDSLYAMQGAKAAGCGVIAIEEATAEKDRGAIRDIADCYICSYDELLTEKN